MSQFHVGWVPGLCVKNVDEHAFVCLSGWSTLSPDFTYLLQTDVTEIKIDAVTDGYRETPSENHKAKISAGSASPKVIMSRPQEGILDPIYNERY